MARVVKSHEPGAGGMYVPPTNPWKVEFCVYQMEWSFPEKKACLAEVINGDRAEVPMRHLQRRGFDARLVNDDARLPRGLYLVVALASADKQSPGWARAV